MLKDIVGIKKRNAWTKGMEQMHNEGVYYILTTYSRYFLVTGIIIRIAKYLEIYFQ